MINTVIPNTAVFGPTNFIGSYFISYFSSYFITNFISTASTTARMTVYALDEKGRFSTVAGRGHCSTCEVQRMRSCMLLFH